MIKTENLSKKYGEQLALNKVNIALSENKITGLIGPNGAGKSTLMKLICGYMPATSGSIFIDEALVNTNNTQLRKKIGYLPESNPLYYEMYVKEYLLYVAGIYHVSNQAEKIKHVIKMIGLNKEQHKKIGQLSKGYKQRVGLAQAIIHDPEVLILDEPTSGLDPNQIIEIRELIQELGKNKTVLLSTHILQEVEAICDEVVVINNGNIIKHDRTDRIQQSNKSSLVVEFDKNPVLEELLSLNFIENAHHVKDTIWIITGKDYEDIRSRVFKFAVEKNLVILSSQIERKKLEDIFRELTKE